MTSSSSIRMHLQIGALRDRLERYIPTVRAIQTRVRVDSIWKAVDRVWIPGITNAVALRVSSRFSRFGLVRSIRDRLESSVDGIILVDPDHSDFSWPASQRVWIHVTLPLLRHASHVMRTEHEVRHG